MQIDGYIQALREDLVRVASLGDETTSRAAELLSVAIEASLARRLQDVASIRGIVSRPPSTISTNIVAIRWCV